MHERDLKAGVNDSKYEMETNKSLIKACCSLTFHGMFIPRETKVQRKPNLSAQCLITKPCVTNTRLRACTWNWHISVDFSRVNCLPCWNDNSPARSQSVTYMNPRWKGELDKILRPSQRAQNWRHESVAPKEKKKLCNVSLSCTLSHTRTQSLTLLCCVSNRAKSTTNGRKRILSRRSVSTSVLKILQYYMDIQHNDAARYLTSL